MQLQGKTVLVTGADGFIGSHLTETLIQQGITVKALTNYNSQNYNGWLDRSTFKHDCEIIAGDIRNFDMIKHTMRGCDLVLHLAALVGIPYSYLSPSAYVDTNIIGTLNIVQAARELGVEKVVHTSSSEVYGTVQFVPITEEHPLQGKSPYAASKIGADQLALSFYLSFGTPIAVARPFNTYGPRQSTRAVIPAIITQMLSGKTEIELGALHPTRDFNFVQDTVDGFIAIAASDHAVGQVINIASNFEISIKDTAQLIANTLSQPLTIICKDERLRPKDSEVDRLYASNEKARRLLNWSPNYGGLDGFKRGIAKTVDWFSQAENIQHYKTSGYSV